MTSRPVPRSGAVPALRGDAAGPPLSERGWRITVLVLHLAFAALVGSGVVYVLVSDDVDGDHAVLLTALVVLALGYLLLGAPGVAARDTRRSAGYFAVLVTVVAVLAWEQPSLLFLMFLAFPQIWFSVGSVRAGLLWTLALGAASVVGPLVHWAQGDEPLSGPGRTLVGLAFSIAMGLWVTRVLEHSEERAVLIRELERTRAELAEAHHQQGITAERERWAREVHDTLAQGYTSIVVLAQTAAVQLPAQPDAAAERIALIEEVARENLGEARAMVAAFAPVALDSSTLVEALARLSERFGRETGLATRLDTAALADGGTLSRAEEIVLLRGAQEALANVRRHACASAVVLRVSRVGDVVAVHVEDDGVGFDAGTGEGVGLAGLRDRAEQVGGAVDVSSAPGAGTRVTVRVPTR